VLRHELGSQVLPFLYGVFHYGPSLKLYMPPKGSVSWPAYRV